MTFVSTQDKVRSWIMACLPGFAGAVIWDKQNAPVPVLPYVLLSLTPITGFIPNHDYIHPYTASRTRTIEVEDGEDIIEEYDAQCLVGDREQLLSVMICANQPNELARTLINNNSLPSVIEQRFIQGITINNIEGPMDVSELFENKWERKSNVDFILTLVDKFEEEVVTIDSIDITSTYKDHDSTTITENHITITEE